MRAPFVDAGDAKVYLGDAATVLAELPAGIAQTCVTSPPYWALRDYGTGEEQIGLEPTPELYVERLVAVFREVWRVLRDDGTLWLNIGDVWATGAGAVGDAPGGGARGAKWKAIARTTPPNRLPIAGLKRKDLIGLPWRLAFALQADGWYLRSEIIWAKPDPMIESVRDRPTKAHEQIFLLAKRPVYFYDDFAVKEPHSPDGRRQTGRTSANGTVDHHRLGAGERRERWPGAGRNRRSVWTVGTGTYDGDHHAAYPTKLIDPCVLAGTSELGECSECGAPWIRILADRGRGPTFAPLAITQGDALPDGPGTHRNLGGRYQKWLDENPPQTEGWEASCSCAARPRPQTVLDPFVGTGTTLVCARKHGRRSIGVDNSSDYAEQARARLAQLSLLTPELEEVEL